MMLCLSGCAARSSVNYETRDLILPTIKEYTPKQQAQLADEIADKPTALLFIKDYDKMIQETRIAKSALTSSNDKAPN